MSYIEFDRSQLVNLEYSLNRELLRTNRSGAYACTTIINCNTRKYHGLLVVPQPQIDEFNHVLLASLDETVIQNGAEFHLGIHKYPCGNYFPKGHKYLRHFVSEPIPRLEYNVGGVVLSKEIVFLSNDNRVMIKYTLEDAHSPTTLKFMPYLAFRNVHSLTRANIAADTRYIALKNGTRMCLYDGYSPLSMQFSKKPVYVHVPDWYYNIEYDQEMSRGYDYQEDQFIPGFFEVPIKKGESIYFTAGLAETDPALLKDMFACEVEKRTPRDSYENCLRNSAQQFIVQNGNKTEIVAGYPWFGRWGRDTFISLPGLTLVTGRYKTCQDIFGTMLAELNGPLFPNMGQGDNAAYNSADAPFWFFWALQQYAYFTGTIDHIWEEYGNKIKMILDGLRKGVIPHIRMDENFLIFAGEHGKALTWMDAVVDGRPVTPRHGYAVEINALWYNAVMFSMEAARYAGDEDFLHIWGPISMQIPAHFKSTFWSKDIGHLADYVYGDHKDFSVRPNQIFAASLPYNPVSEKIRELIVKLFICKLLTPRGIRTLTPLHPEYKGVYSGNQKERDEAYHQGTVWPWLFGHFAEAYLKIYKKTGVEFIRTLYEDFEETMKEACLGSVSEVYDGDPPHHPGGAISQAWSVAELLRVGWLIKKYEYND